MTEKGPLMLQRSTWILIVLLTAAFLGTGWLSAVGAGLPKPEDAPVSLREGSARMGDALALGVLHTRYFQGGGLHDGK